MLPILKSSIVFLLIFTLTSASSQKQTKDQNALENKNFLLSGWTQLLSLFSNGALDENKFAPSQLHPSLSAYVEQDQNPRIEKTLKVPSTFLKKTPHHVHEKKNFKTLKPNVLVSQHHSKHHNLHLGKHQQKFLQTHSAQDDAVAETASTDVVPESEPVVDDSTPQTPEETTTAVDNAVPETIPTEAPATADSVESVDEVASTDTIAQAEAAPTDAAAAPEIISSDALASGDAAQPSDEVSPDTQPEAAPVETVAEEPAAEEPAAEEPAAEEPVVEEPAPEEPIDETATDETVPVDDPNAAIQAQAAATDAKIEKISGDLDGTMDGIKSQLKQTSDELKTIVSKQVDEALGAMKQDVADSATKVAEQIKAESEVTRQKIIDSNADLKNEINVVGEKLDKTTAETLSLKIVLLNKTLKDRQAELEQVQKEIVELQSKLPPQDTGICSKNTECDACTADPRCGWCSSEQKCVEGDQIGPLYTVCNFYDYGKCSGSSCIRYNDCYSCLQDPLCGWCQNENAQAGSCMEQSADYAGCPNEWYHSQGIKNLCDLPQVTSADPLASSDTTTGTTNNSADVSKMKIKEMQNQFDNLLKREGTLKLEIMDLQAQIKELTEKQNAITSGKTARASVSEPAAAQGTTTTTAAPPAETTTTEPVVVPVETPVSTEPQVQETAADTSSSTDTSADAPIEAVPEETVAETTPDETTTSEEPAADTATQEVETVPTENHEQVVAEESVIVQESAPVDESIVVEEAVAIVVVPDESTLSEEAQPEESTETIVSEEAAVVVNVEEASIESEETANEESVTVIEDIVIPVEHSEAVSGESLVEDLLLSNAEVAAE